nr:MAG TPA: hypothetical protein [Caudoviricetes sp.]
MVKNDRQDSKQRGCPLISRLTFVRKLKVSEKGSHGHSKKRVAINEKIE